MAIPDWEKKKIKEARKIENKFFGPHIAKMAEEIRKNAKKQNEIDFPSLNK